MKSQNLCRLSLVLITATLALTQVANGQPENRAERRTLDTLDVLRSMAGEWEGELEYADYGTGKRVRIPAAMAATVSPDGLFVTAQLRYTDPGGEKHMTEVATITPGNDKVACVFLSDRNVEPMTYDILARQITDATTWRVVIARDGTDGGKPARTRVTRELRNGELRSRTEVNSKAAGRARWEFRNELRLKRVTAPATDTLKGNWKVDLRPTPDAPPYYQNLVIDTVDGKSFTGTFYDAPIQAATLNTDWGDLRLAFTTEDGTGRYNTTAVLRRRGRLEGTTHSIGRGFLSVWTAERAPSAPE